MLANAIRQMNRKLNLETVESTRIFCNEIYMNSKSEEGWIKCQNWKGWAHEACACLDDDNYNFTCDP